MQTSQYSKGRAIEAKIVNFLKAEGYNAVRSAGSKGAFDVIAYNDSVVRFIQSKYTNDPDRGYKTDLRKMSECLVPQFCTRELWVYLANKGFYEIHLMPPIHQIVIPKGIKIIYHEQI